MLMSLMIEMACQSENSLPQSNVMDSNRFLVKYWNQLVIATRTSFDFQLLIFIGMMNLLIIYRDLLYLY